MVRQREEGKGGFGRQGEEGDRPRLTEVVRGGLIKQRRGKIQYLPPPPRPGS